MRSAEIPLTDRVEGMSPSCPGLQSQRVMGVDSPWSCRFQAQRQQQEYTVIRVAHSRAQRQWWGRKSLQVQIRSPETTTGVDSHWRCTFQHPQTAVGVDSLFFYFILFYPFIYNAAPECSPRGIYYRDRLPKKRDILKGPGVAPLWSPRKLT